MKFLKVGVMLIMLPCAQIEARQNFSVQISECININATHIDYHNYRQDCQTDQDISSESKTFTKSFPLNQAEKVNLKNVFGNINIITWDKKEVKIDADIRAYAATKAQAQKLLDQTNVTAVKNGGEVSVITHIETENEIIIRENGKKLRRQETRVYLTVYMPADNELKASQKFGNIVLPDFLGPTTSTVKFGNLKTGDLKNVKNTISIQYGDADLQNVNEAKITHQYGNGIIVSINNLELNSQYSSIRVGRLKGAGNIHLQYGNGISIASANNIDANIQYSTLKADKLTGNLKTTTKYGKIIVNEITPTSKTIYADIQYTPISLTFSPAYGGNFKVNTAYGSFKYAGNIKVKKVYEEDDDYGDKTYEGSINQDGANSVFIDSRYGSVSFFNK